jgi:hypothetical protein
VHPAIQAPLASISKAIQVLIDADHSRLEDIICVESLPHPAWDAASDHEFEAPTKPLVKFTPSSRFIF